MTFTRDLPLTIDIDIQIVKRYLILANYLKFGERVFSRKEKKIGTGYIAQGFDAKKYMNRKGE